MRQIPNFRRGRTATADSALSRCVSKSPYHGQRSLESTYTPHRPPGQPDPHIAQPRHSIISPIQGPWQGAFVGNKAINLVRSLSRNASWRASQGTTIDQTCASSAGWPAGERGSSRWPAPLARKEIRQNGTGSGRTSGAETRGNSRNWDRWLMPLRQDLAVL